MRPLSYGIVSLVVVWNSRGKVLPTTASLRWLSVVSVTMRRLVNRIEEMNPCLSISNVRAVRSSIAPRMILLASNSNAKDVGR